MCWPWLALVKQFSFWEEKHGWKQSAAGDSERQLWFSKSFVLACLHWARMPECYCFYMSFIFPHSYLLTSSPHDQMLDLLTKHSTAGCLLWYGWPCPQRDYSPRRVLGHVHRICIVTYGNLGQVLNVCCSLHALAECRRA